MSRFQLNILSIMYFAVLPLLIFPDLLNVLGNAFIGFGDSALYVWLTYRNGNYFQSVDGDIFKLPFYYPENDTLAFSDNYILPSFFSFILQKLGASLFLSYNLPILLAFVLNGLSAYFFLMYFYKSKISGFFSGTLFCVSPFFVSQLQHPQLLYAFIFPFIFITIDKFFKTRQSRYSFLLGLLILCAYATSMYYLFYSILLSLFFFVSLLFIKKQSKILEFIYLFTKGMFIPAVLLFVGLIPYVKVANKFGTRSIKTISQPVGMGSFFSTSENNFLWGRITGSFSNHETHYFIGIFGMFFLLYFFQTLLKEKFRNKAVEKSVRFNNSISIIIGSIGVVFLCLSFGVFRSGFPSPYLLFYRVLPGFSSLRACGRLAVITYLILITFSGLGFSSFIGSLKSKYVRSGLTFLVIALVILEGRTNYLPHFQLPTALSANDLYLSNQSNEALIVLPFPRFVRNEAEYSGKQLFYMLTFRDILNPMVNGYSGIITPFHRRINNFTRHFPSEKAIHKIMAIGSIKYVVYFSSLVEGFDKTNFEKQISQFPSLSLKGEVNGIYTFEIQS